MTAVHDPRSPCEGSQEAVHPVIPLETLRETLVDGPVEDEKAVNGNRPPVVGNAVSAGVVSCRPGIAVSWTGLGCVLVTGPRRRG